MKLLLLMKASYVLCFWKYGHQKLGYILEQNLKRNHLQLYTKLEKYLLLEPGLTIEEASIWADRMKKRPKYCWTPPMHYVNLFGDSTNMKSIKEYCDKNDGICLYNGIIKYQQPKNIEQFKFLIHLTQDLFQPLHIYGPYKGGNSKKVIVYDKFKNGKQRINKMSMHTLWDDYLIKKQFKKTKPEYFIKTHKEILNSTISLDNYLLQIFNEHMDLGSNMIYNFSNKNINIPDYYNNEYTYLINDYLTFMKYIINKL